MYRPVEYRTIPIWDEDDDESMISPNTNRRHNHFWLNQNPANNITAADYIENNNAVSW
jgi:hypothetical protein